MCCQAQSKGQPDWKEGREREGEEEERRRRNKCNAQGQLTHLARTKIKKVLRNQYSTMLCFSPRELLCNPPYLSDAEKLLCMDGQHAGILRNICKKNKIKRFKFNTCFISLLLGHFLCYLNLLFTLKNPEKP
jgi:hypothetical protein